MLESLDIARKCLRDEANAILGLEDLLDSNFTKAVDMICNSKGKLVITGVGKSGHVGQKIAATLASLGTPAFFLNPLDAYHGDLGMLAQDDILMAISYSGNTDELLRIIPPVKERQIKIIAMSSNPNSLLGKNSDCHITIKVEREADPLNLAPTSSTTATMAMGDAIACALVYARDFKDSDFARFHPGGSLGRMLLSRVADNMIKTNLPTVQPTTKVSEAIFEISKNKQGIAAVISDNHVVGAITDGDIRRAMQKNQQAFFTLEVEEIMNSKPKTILPNAKLTEAEQIMRTNSIHSLIVVDEKGAYVGIIDYFCCL